MVHRTAALDARTISETLEWAAICTVVNPNSYYALLVRGSGVEESDSLLCGCEPDTPKTSHSYDASAPRQPCGAPSRGDHGAGHRGSPAHDHRPRRGPSARRRT